jgi:YgiT-type zinc finger domain-containing protein
MPADSSDPIHAAQDALAAWHATHPRATFAEMEVAVEAQLDRIRAQLLAERASGTFVEEQPLCPQCGGTMKPKTTGTRTVVLRGDQPCELSRPYLVCRDCGYGLFPPG